MDDWKTVQAKTDLIGIPKRDGSQGVAERGDTFECPPELALQLVCRGHVKLTQDTEDS